MPNPKRQHSRQRSKKRRTHYKARISGLRPCPQCQKMTISHRVCSYCGYYKGKAVVVAQIKEEKKP